jgi:hypothetical protein
VVEAHPAPLGRVEGSPDQPADEEIVRDDHFMAGRSPSTGPVDSASASRAGGTPFRYVTPCHDQPHSQGALAASRRPSRKARKVRTARSGTRDTG